MLISRLPADAEAIEGINVIYFSTVFQINHAYPFKSILARGGARVGRAIGVCIGGL